MIHIQLYDGVFGFNLSSGNSKCKTIFFSFFCGLNVELMRQQSYLGNWMENNAYLELVLVP